jgi:hypothetical protein
MSESFAFIDESGNEGMDLGKPDVSSTYVVVSLVLTSEQMDRATTALSAAKASYEDVRCFVERQRTTVDPLMHRILLARRAVKVATNDSIDILRATEFANLKAALDTGEEWLPSNGTPTNKAL